MSKPKLYHSRTPGVFWWKCDGEGCPNLYHRLPGVGPRPAIHHVKLGLERDTEGRWKRWAR